MFGIGPMELVLILVVALLVLGPKRMPDLARTLGRGLSEFRRASNDLRQSLALDDLQNDLRKGISEKGTIHKPGQDEDRPAQAGDDLAPGSPEDATDTPAAGEAPKPHPGELPLDQDPHEHKDEEEAAAPESRPAPADPDLGNVPVGATPTQSSTRTGSSDDKRG